jgi:hypothetical protein
VPLAKVVAEYSYDGKAFTEFKGKENQIAFLAGTFKMEGCGN